VRRIRGRTTGVQADEGPDAAWTFRDMKIAWRSGAWWRDLAWRSHFATTAGGLLTVLLSSPGVWAQTGPAQALTEGPALALSLAVAADSSPVYPTRVFPTNAPEIIAVARLAKGQAAHTLSATWVMLGAAGSGPGTVLLKSDTPVGTSGGFFGLKGPLRAGRYRLDVTADGAPWQSADFTVTDPVRAPAVRRPQDLLPLASGTTWTYASTQQWAEGNTPADATLDPDGKSRGTWTVTVKGPDEHGILIERRWNGEHHSDQAYRVTERGIELTWARGAGEPASLVEPPKVVWAFPLAPPRSWLWQSANGGQSFQMWGPVPVQGPRGEAAGYVVLIKWHETLSDGVLTHSVERHYLPGVGLLREIETGGANGIRMLWRVELVLKGVP
jgi:hypothetical protein